jgi:hypothetical protein
MNEINTKIDIKPNCKDVLIKFKEPLPDGFELQLQLNAEDALNVANRLIAAARTLQEKQR